MGSRTASILLLSSWVVSCGGQTEPENSRHAEAFDAGRDGANDDRSGDDESSDAGDPSRPSSESSPANSAANGGEGGTTSNPGLGGATAGGSGPNGAAGRLGVGGTAEPTSSTGGRGGATGEEPSPPPFLNDESCGAPLLRGFRRLLPAQAKRALLHLEPELSLAAVDDDVLEQELAALTSLAPLPPDASAEDVVMMVHGEVLALDPLRFPSLSGLVEDVAVQWAALHQPVDDCAAATPLSDCLLELLAEVANEAYRRPLYDAEKPDFLERALLDADPELMDPDTAIHNALFRILLNPHFLARSELGNPVAGFRVLRQSEAPPALPTPFPLPPAPAPPAQWVLSEYELATAVAFDVTDGPPDGELLDAAAAATLSDNDGLQAQLQRLLDYASSHDALSAMTLRWFDIHPPKPDNALAVSAYQESRDFVERVLFSEGTLGDLLQSTDALLPDDVATAYGVPSSDSGSWTLLPERPGLLSRLAFGQFTRWQGYYRHGLLLGSRLLCVNVPLPPEEFHDPLPPESGYALATQEVPCSACHSFFTPASNPFLVLNGVGTDPSGTYYSTGSVPFADIVELMALLSQDPIAVDCALRTRALTFLDTVDTPEHECWLLALETQTFGGSLLDVVRATVLSNTYRVRR